MNPLSTSASSDSEDINLKEFLLILSSITFSATLFSCYMKYLLSNNSGTTRIIEPTTSSDFQEQL